MKKLIIVLFLISIKASYCFAQSKMMLFEDTLAIYGNILNNDTIQENRTKANYTFIKTLVSSLKEKNSFQYTYDSLQNIISIKKSDDNKFRIFSWFTQNDDGSYRFFGAIQMNNPNKLELYPLIDQTQQIQISVSLPDSTLTPEKWFGAVYYQILPVLGIKEPYYILLGWKGKNLSTNHKVVETLYFKDGKPQFGTAVLEKSAKSNDFAKRIVYTYTKEANMLLRYIKDEKMIVFDHLVASSEETAGIFDLYAPDLSYDGYKFKSGKWLIQENLKLSNLPDEDDEFFIDPAKDGQNIRPLIKQ